MVIEATQLRVLDPTAETLPQDGHMAARPGSLDGKVVGLLANGKRNSDRLLYYVYELLAERYQVAGVIPVDKRDASRPAAPQFMKEVSQADVVLVGIGD